MFSVFAVHKKSQWYATPFSKDKLHGRQYVDKPQFSFTTTLGSELRFKSRLLPFSLVCNQRLCVFCFLFCNLQLLSKCWYTLTVWLGILAHSKSRFCRCVLCWLTGKYHCSVWQGAQFLVSLIWRPILPDSVWNGLSSLELYSQTGHYQP